MTNYINTLPVRAIWEQALPALAGVKNGDYLPIDRLRAAFAVDAGRKLQDVLAAGERDGLVVVDRGAIPTTYRATFRLERLLPAVDNEWQGLFGE